VIETQKKIEWVTPYQAWGTKSLALLMQRPWCYQVFDELPPATGQIFHGFLVVDAWLADLMVVCVSNALAYKYNDVLSRKLSEERCSQIMPVLGQLLSVAQ
jgi:hypothetical protein